MLSMPKSCDAALAAPRSPQRTSAPKAPKRAVVVPDCPRVFVIFDRANDTDLFEQLRGESLDGQPRFEIAAQSEPATPITSETWQRALENVDEVIVICGTAGCAAVSTELRAVQHADKPYFLLWGRRELMCRKPQSARRDDSMYSWTSQILAVRLQETLRQARFCGDRRGASRPTAKTCASAETPGT
jgi:hypothetical protein